MGDREVGRGGRRGEEGEVGKRRMGGVREDRLESSAMRFNVRPMTK